MNPPDILIIGAGASGAVAARRLAQDGFDVVCLEQGDRTDPGAYRGAYDDWELTGLRQWTWDPNIRQARADYPVGVSESDIDPLMFNGVGGSTVQFAAQWPRLAPSDFRVRTLDGVADDWPLTYEELQPFYERSDVDFGVSGLGGDPAYPPGAEPPLPPLPVPDVATDIARAHNRLGWHWWPRPNRLPPPPPRPPPPIPGAAALRPARHLRLGLRGGRQGIHRPDPLARRGAPRRPLGHRRTRA